MDIDLKVLASSFPEHGGYAGAANAQHKVVEQTIAVQLVELGSNRKFWTPGKSIPKNGTPTRFL